MTFMPAHKATGAMAPGQVRNPIPGNAPNFAQSQATTAGELTIQDVIKNSLATELPPKNYLIKAAEEVGAKTMPPWDVWWHSRPKGFMPKHIEDLIKEELDISYD